MSCYVQLDGCMDYFCVQSFSHFFNARSKSDLLLFSKNFGNQNVHFVFFLASLLPGSLTVEINIYWWFEWRKQVLTYSQQIERSNWVAFIIFWQFNSRNILVKIFKKQSQEYKLKVVTTYPISNWLNDLCLINFVQHLGNKCFAQWEYERHWNERAFTSSDFEKE